MEDWQGGPARLLAWQEELDLAELGPRARDALVDEPSEADWPA